MNSTVWSARGHNRFRLLGICGAALMSAVVPAAQADDSLIQECGQISLGTFTNNSEMKIRVDAEGDQGSVVDWGNTFGDKDVTRRPIRNHSSTRTRRALSAQLASCS